MTNPATIPVPHPDGYQPGPSEGVEVLVLTLQVEGVAVEVTYELGSLRTAPEAAQVLASILPLFQRAVSPPAVNQLPPVAAPRPAPAPVPSPSQPPAMVAAPSGNPALDAMRAGAAAPGEIAPSPEQPAGETQAEWVARVNTQAADNDGIDDCPF